MKIDVFVPKNNEKVLLDLAEKLGFQKIILLYEDDNQMYKEKTYGKLKVFTAKLIKNVSEAQKASKNHDFVFALAQRPFFENKTVTHLFNAEILERTDGLHQRRSGLDEVMCKLAFEKGKTIVFNLSLLKKSEVLGRMKQNMSLCKKYKLKTIVSTFATKPIEMRAHKDLAGFERLLN